MRLLTEIESKFVAGGIGPGMDDPVDIPPVTVPGPVLPGGGTGGGGGGTGGGVGAGEDGGGRGGGGAGTPTFKWDAPVTFSAVGSYDDKSHTNSLAGTYNIGNGWTLQATSVFSTAGVFQSISGSAKYTDGSGITSTFNLSSTDSSFRLNSEYNTGFDNGWSLKISAAYNSGNGEISGQILFGHIF